MAWWHRNEPQSTRLLVQDIWGGIPQKCLHSEGEDQQNDWQNVVSILQRSAGLSEAPGNGLFSTMHNGCNPHLDWQLISASPNLGDSHRSRHEYGFKNSQGGKCKHSGKLFKTLPTQLGKGHAKPMGVRCSIRIPYLLEDKSRPQLCYTWTAWMDRPWPSELKALGEKRAVDPVDHTRRSLISPMFVVPKGDRAWWPVINLN